jgi:SAM-dependent methyltransferase
MADQNGNGTEVLQYYKELEAKFDRAAQMYDATYGTPNESGRGNALLGWLRARHLDILRDIFEPGATVLDIGCATGEQAVTLAGEGYAVLGIDISPAMVRQAQTKAAVYGVQRQATFRCLAAGRLDLLDERGPFQGAYASLGTLNMEPDLPGFVHGLHARLERGAAFVATVMNRRCLYEFLYNLVRLKPGDTRRRPPGWTEGKAGPGGVVAPIKHYTPAVMDRGKSRAGRRSRTDQALYADPIRRNL